MHTGANPTLFSEIFIYQKQLKKVASRHRLRLKDRALTKNVLLRNIQGRESVDMLSKAMTRLITRTASKVNVRGTLRLLSEPGRARSTSLNVRATSFTGQVFPVFILCPSMSTTTPIPGVSDEN